MQKQEEKKEQIDNTFEEIDAMLKARKVDYGKPSEPSEPEVEDKKDDDEVEEKKDIEATTDVDDKDKEDVVDEKDDKDDKDDEEKDVVASTDDKDKKDEDDDVTVDQMRERMNELAKITLGKKVDSGGEVVEDRKEKKEEIREEETKKTVEAITKMDLTQEEYDDLMENPSKFSNIMSKKFGGLMEGRIQEVLRVIPGVVNRIVDERVEIRLAAMDFYRDNPDLTKFKSVVGVVANELFGKNPDWGYEDGFEKVGEEVRKRLGLKKGEIRKTSPDVKEEEKQPAFVSKKKSRSPQPIPLEGVAGEIDRMIKLRT